MLCPHHRTPVLKSFFLFSVVICRWWFSRLSDYHKKCDVVISTHDWILTFAYARKNICSLVKFWKPGRAGSSAEVFVLQALYACNIFVFSRSRFNYIESGFYSSIVSNIFSETQLAIEIDACFFNFHSAVLTHEASATDLWQTGMFLVTLFSRQIYRRSGHPTNHVDYPVHHIDHLEMFHI